MNNVMDTSAPLNSETCDFSRRFGGVARLYGELGFAKLQESHVAVIGVGGVGSWAAEALARNAVGTITLVDLDHVAESNVNRQLHALGPNFGKAKITAMAERMRLINPRLTLIEIEDFIAPDNLGSLLSATFDGIIDCTDDAKAKIALAAFCKARRVPFIMVGGAGGRLDPTRIRNADLSEVHHDPLLAKVRQGLRRDHGFPKGRDGIKQKQPKMHVTCIYSDEPVIQPDRSCDASSAPLPAANLNANAITGLNCAGYGSSVCVTAPFGFAAVALLLATILNKS